MNKLQTWFIVVGAFLGVGIPLLFIGIQVPSAMLSAILANAAEYVILDEDDYMFWAVVPGTTGMSDTKEFYIFNCTNPEEVALRGVSPKFVEIGPFVYKYSHEFDKRDYDDDKSVKNTRVHFIKKYKHEYKGNRDDLEKEYRVINFSGMKRWRNAKEKPRFKLAIEGFFETFAYSKRNFVRDYIIDDVIHFYDKLDNIFYLTKNLTDVTREVTIALASDPYYGLMKKFNIYEWTQICESSNPRIEHEIFTYFGFSLSSFVEIKRRFCQNYRERYNKGYQQLCSKITPMICSNYNISYYQWMHGNLLNGSSYGKVTYKKLFGIYEFAFYRTKFEQMLQKKYKKQFKDIDWTTKNYHHLLDTYHEYPDYKTDKASLLLYDNMNKLYKAGRNTRNPFHGNLKDDVLDLSRFEQIANILKVTKEQAFMLYSYFEYYVNNTVLMQDLDGDPSKERIGNYGAAVLKDITEYCSDFLDVVIYTRSLNTRMKPTSCSEAAKRYFFMNKTEKVIENIAKAICTNTIFRTDVSTPVGLKYFVEANSYPYGESYRKLNNYLLHSVTNFTSEMLNAMVYNGSFFAKELNNIKITVKKHYQFVSNNEACINKFSPYCTKRQLFFSQFQKSYITTKPYAESLLPGSSYVADWWRIILPYIEYNLTNSENSPTVPNVTLPDQPIEIPMELPFLRENYNGADIPRVELYKCFNNIKLFDTDVLYDILLKGSQGKVPDECESFATPFFYKSIRYLIRNIQFGPMFSRVHPEEVYFGYFNRWLDIEHALLDYLEGDDCTVNPWIGVNPIQWNITHGAQTLNYLDVKHLMYTGSEDNKLIRKYAKYHNSDTIFYKKLVQDISGDNCIPQNADPFIVKIPSSIATDELQFSQHGGNTKQWDSKLILESNVFRPLQIVRKTDDYYYYHKLDVDCYVLDFMNEYYSHNGVNFMGGIDMTAFYQYWSVVTPVRYANISEPSFHLPEVVYKRPIEKDLVPSGVSWNESYFIIEPYTGITMQFVKKMMISLVLHYDELYEVTSKGGRGELMPYYSLYENATASENFANLLDEKVLSSQLARHVISITFIMLGLILIIGGVAMIIRACFFELDDLMIDYSEELAADEIMEALAKKNKPQTSEILNPLLNDSEEPIQLGTASEEGKPPEVIPQPEVIPNPEVTGPEVELSTSETKNRNGIEEKGEAEDSKEKVEEKVEIKEEVKDKEEKVETGKELEEVQEDVAITLAEIEDEENLLP